MNRRVACVVLAELFSATTFTLIGSQSQRAADVPILQGSFAVQLSPQDIANIETVLPRGVKPWLLGGGDCLFCEAMITAYLPPDTETAELRRGRGLVLQPPAGLIKGGMPTHNAPNSWVLMDKSISYAQLPPVGKTFEPTSSTKGLITIVGDFSDTELLSVVSFVRSNDRWAGSLEVLSRDNIGVIQLQIHPDSGRGRLLARIRREGQVWIILSESLVSAE
jgi:hypothetical protein